MNSNLPHNWKLIKLGEICDIIMGQSPPSSTYNIAKVGLPFFQGKAEFTELYPEVKKWCSEPNKIAESLDILVSVRAPVGSTNIANQKCCIGRGLAAIRYPDCNKFIFYYFRLIEKKLDGLGTGSTFKAITSKTLNNLLIPLPPLPEQKKIVEKIEELFSELDSGVDSLKKAKAQLKIYRQAVLSFAFSGRLLKDDIFNDVEDKTKDGIFSRKAAEPNVEYGTPPNEWIKGKGLPEGWKEITVKDVCEKIVGGGTPSTKVSKYWKGDINWITSADIYGIKDIRPRRKVNEEAIKNSATNKVPKGTIVVVTRVGLGKVAIAPYDLCFSQDSQGLILNKKLVTESFALWFLSKATEEFKYKNRGTTINGVTKRQLADLRFLLPPLNQQIQIVEEIEKRFSEADNLEKAIDESLGKAEALRQSILKKAFEGKLV
jgi:type I restriction enzyme S subunit